MPKQHNILIRFIKNILDPTKYTSIKSLAMLSAIVISFGLSACLGYTMIRDVEIDGILNMDLIDAGVFITCIGSFMTLSSVPKVIIDNVRAKRGLPKEEEEMPEEDVEEKNDE